MPASKSPVLLRQPSPSFALLGAVLAVLWVAGGASRADTLGQVVVRGSCVTALVVAILFGDRPPADRRRRPVVLLVGATVLLVLLQLVPLPPGIWQSLPGRDMLKEAAAASGQAQPWRPLSIVPGATLNAAASLLVPVTVLLLASGLREREWLWLPGMMLGLVTLSTALALLQFSGASVANPLINETPGSVSGSFANRNHLAIFLVIGCLLVPVWMFLDGRRPGWRSPVGLGLLLLFFLTILASGSRAGLGLGVLALAAGPALVGRDLKRELRRYPRWVVPVLFLAIVAVLTIAVLISVAAGRAASIDRTFALDPGQDMRGRGLPTVLGMVRAYLPWGAGFGGFDPLFRMHEPFALLKLTYFNHAHNDLLEVVLDGGLPALLLLAAAIGWWAHASLRAWRDGDGRAVLPRLGSVTLLLVVIASAFDYPARTPMIMATVVIAALWLGGVSQPRRVRPALPAVGQHL